jgi:opacity protein-like surface antigen
MLRNLLAAALFVALLPSQTLAQVERPGAYVETRVGLFQAEDNTGKYDDSSTSTTTDIDFDPGWAVEVATGYYINNHVRGELALGWRQVEVDDFELGGVPEELDEGYFGLFTAMLNGYLEWPVDKFRPFIGGGAGFGFFDAEIRTRSGSVDVDTGNFVFAYQALAGLAYEITPSITLTGTYSYLGTTDTEDDFFGSKINLDGVVIKDYRAHTLMFGVRYFF